MKRLVSVSKQPVSKRSAFTQIGSPLLVGLMMASSVSVAQTAGHQLPAQAPLFAAVDIAAPNIMVTLADSGAMMADVNQLYGAADDLWHQTIFMNGFTPHKVVPFEERWWTTSGVGAGFGTYKYSILWRSSTYNQLYYNPEVHYKPWLRPNPTTGMMERMPAANPVCAKRFPDGATGDDRIGSPNNNLNTPCVMMTPAAAIDGGAQLAPAGRAPARYYRYIGSMPPVHDSKITFATSINDPARPINSYHYRNIFAGQKNEKLFERVDIVPTRTSYPKGAKRSDCKGSVCTYAEEIQNFANWYMYHRSRINAARAGIAEVMAEYNGNVRVGFATTTGDGIWGPSLNPNSHTSKKSGLTKTTNADGFATPFIKLPIREFTGKHKKDFYFELFNRLDIGFSNVASVVDTVGRYFQVPPTNRASPWLDKPGSLGGKTPSVCRRSYHIISTEGGWNDDGSYVHNDQYTPSQGALSGGGSNLINGRPNVDNLDASLAPIFRDTVSNTIADLMTYYYINDLQPNIADSVKPSADELRNGFTDRHQRLTTFGLSFGLPLSFDMEQRKQQIAQNLNQTVVWQSPYAPPAGSWHKFHRINDIAHGTLNTGGELFMGSNTDQVAEALGKILTIATSDGQSEPRYARSSSRIDKNKGMGNRLFDTLFINDGQWYGDVKLYEIDKIGQISDIGLSAAQSIYNRYADARHTSRNIWSSDPYSSRVVQFTEQGLSTAWKNDLAGNVATAQANLIAYLRGDTRQERIEQRPTAPYRNRNKHLLGDIVNSLGVVVHTQNEGWHAWEAKEGIKQDSANSYTRFLKRKATINPHLYVGANDGMFHVFDVEAQEVFAYIPKVLRHTLKEYAALDYGHRFYVDGAPTLADAKFNGWQRVVLSPLGAGGRGLFALNATDADNPSVMWDIDDSDLKTNNQITAATNIGFIQGGVRVDRTESEGWVAITGNGYDVPPTGSLSRQPALLVFNLEKGSLIASIAVGQLADYTGANGLGAVATLISDDKTRVDAAYAGDWNGNLWRFDLRGSASQWRSQVTLIAQSRDAQGKPQPIVAAPAITSFPERIGVRLFWGTGSYLTIADHENISDVNSIYGIWDEWDRSKHNPTPAVLGRNHLVERKITRSFTQQLGVNPPTNYQLRTITGSKTSYHAGKRGWYLDLVVDNAKRGERVVYSPIVVPGSLLIFNSMTPSGDMCEGGIENRSYVLDVNGLPQVFGNNDALGLGTGGQHIPINLSEVGAIELKDNAMPLRPETLMLNLMSQNEKMQDELYNPLTVDCPLGTRPVKLAGLDLTISCPKDGLGGWLQLQ